ncbi:hypothetical protein VTN31DRAFT_3932 [Thermomyces dupontii]|uniref:uncharacterized protein n=1 Tax=Talaromyces thermophilus TaxID=28565 RepID=UPI0037441CAD
MPPVAVSPQGHGPSTWDKMKMGALMGGTVGAIMGFIGGVAVIFRHGAGPNGILRTLGNYMMGSGATFGLFMSIGSVIRTEGPYHEAWRRAHGRPMVMLPREYPARR